MPAMFPPSSETSITFPTLKLCTSLKTMVATVVVAEKDEIANFVFRFLDSLNPGSAPTL